MARLSFEEPLPVGFYSLNWTEGGDGKSFVRVLGVDARGTEIPTEYGILRSTRKRHLTFFADMPVYAVCLLVVGGSRFDLEGLTLHRGYCV